MSTTDVQLRWIRTKFKNGAFPEHSEEEILFTYFISFEDFTVILHYPTKNNENSEEIN